MIETTPIMLKALNQTVTSIKEYYKVDANNNLQWKATLHGSFTYNGVSSQCTGASCTTTVYQGNWNEKTNNAYPSGNVAIADVTMVRKVFSSQ